MKARRAAEINMEEDIQSILREVERHLRRKYKTILRNESLTSDAD